MEIRRQRRKALKRFIVMSVILLIALIMSFLLAVSGKYMIGLIPFTVCAVIISYYMAKAIDEYEKNSD